MTSAANNFDTSLVLRALSGASPDLIYALDAAGHYLFVSEPGARILGLTVEQMIGRGWADVGLPAEREAEFVTERRRVMETRTSETREVVFQMMDGERVFDYVISPLLDHANEAQGVLVVSRDITPRVHAEQQLRSELNMRQAIERSLTPGLITTSASGQLLYVSDSFVRMVGFSAPELVGRDFPYPHWPPEDHEKLIARLRAMVSGSNLAARSELTLMRKNGDRFPALVETTPLLSEAGKPMGWLGLITDLTQQRRAERELERQNVFLSTLLEVSRTVSAELDLQTLVQAVTDAATTVTGAEFGAFFYNLTDERGQSYTLYTISGVPRERFSQFPMPRNTAVFAPTFEGTGIVRSDDIRADPRYGKNAPYFGMPNGHLPVVSYLAVPVISKSGSVLGGLFFGHSQAGRFTEDAERLVAGIAAQAAVAMDNARLVEETRRAAALVRREEERYRMLVDATSDVVWSTDAAGNAASQHTKWLDLTGQTPQDLRDGRWGDVIHPDDIERVRIAWKEALDTKARYAVEYRVRLRDGSYRWFLARGLPLFDHGGTLREWIGTATDIDDRKRDSEAASFLADASALLSSSLDPETILRRLGEMAVPRLADWCAIDVAADSAPYKRLVVAHSDRSKIDLAMEMDRDYRATPEEDVIAQVMRTGETAMIGSMSPDSLIATARNDRHRMLLRTLGLRSFICVAIRVAGRIFGTLTVVSAESGRNFNDRDRLLVEDIAARAGAAVDNAQLYVAAQEANRAKDEFLATLSHELRTPMTAILGWARMLTMEEEHDPALIASAVTAIERSAIAQAQLIDDLLDVSRISSGKLHLSLEDVDINEIVRGALESARPAANVKRVHIDATLSGAPHAVGDPNRLQQIVWNLVNNAVKFTPAGGRIAVSTDATLDQVIIRVADTGEGIAPDILPVIFDRFRQADSSTTRRFGGLGLGLAIARQIAELHGGRVEAASKGLGQGSTFTVTLPAGRSAISPSPVAPQTSDALNGVEVLIVDDDLETRLFVAAALERAGASVQAVASASEALAAIRKSIPALLLSDIAMPQRDGYALIEDIRNVLHISAEQLPAIAMTAFGGTEDRVRILAAGFQRALMKPLDPADLAKVVAQTARRR
jgi:PAS domain S-box-containing protein